MSALLVTLEEAKAWLRVEESDEDTLIESFIGAAEDIVEGVLRFPLADFEEVPEAIRQGILYAVSQFYENRNLVKLMELTETLKCFLSSYRKEVW